MVAMQLRQPLSAVKLGLGRAEPAGENPLMQCPARSAGTPDLLDLVSPFPSPRGIRLDWPSLTGHRAG